MRSSLSWWILCFCLVFGRETFSQEIPPLHRRVTDEAHMLSPQMIAELEAKLWRYEDSTSNQIAVLTVNSLDESTIEEFSLKVAREWKLGSRGIDNGALLCIAKEDRKIRIEVGYALQRSLTNAIAQNIIDNNIAPRFKQQDYDGGVRDGVLAMMASADGHIYVPSVASTRRMLTNEMKQLHLYIQLFLLAMFIYFRFQGKLSGCYTYVYLMLFFAFLAWLTGALISPIYGVVIFVLYLVGYPLVRFCVRGTAWGERNLSTIIPSPRESWYMRGGPGSAGNKGGYWDQNNSGGFSGLGGKFGGGGASGSW